MTQLFQENGKYYRYIGIFTVVHIDKKSSNSDDAIFIYDYRAARGKHLSLVIRFATPGRNVDDIDIFTHSNDTLASLRRQILRRIKASGTNVKLDLFINGESLEQSDDRKLLSQIPLRDKMVSR